VKRRKSLVLLGYSGVNYTGMQRNPDVPTIEEELLKAMLKNDWINEEGYKTPQQAFFQRAARTDKGVSEKLSNLMSETSLNFLLSRCRLQDKLFR
jgi:tRNA pseudouridine38-40 synthase